MSTVVGIFKNEVDAIKTMEELRDLGYENKDFSIFKKDEVKHSYLLEKDINDDPNGIYRKNQAIGKGRGMEGLILGLEAHRVLDVYPVIGAGPVATDMRYDLATRSYTPMQSLSHFGAVRDDIEIYEKSLHLDYILLAVDTNIVKKPQIKEIFSRNNSVLKENINVEYKDTGLDRRYKSALDEKIKQRKPGVNKSLHPEVKDRAVNPEDGIDKSIHPEVAEGKMDVDKGVEEEIRRPNDKHIRDRDEGVDPNIKHK